MKSALSSIGAIAPPDSSKDTKKFPGQNKVVHEVEWHLTQCFAYQNGGYMLVFSSIRDMSLTTCHLLQTQKLKNTVSHT